MESREPVRVTLGRAPGLCFQAIAEGVGSSSQASGVCWSVCLHRAFRKPSSWTWAGLGQGGRREAGEALFGSRPSALPTAGLKGVRPKDKSCDWPLC